MRTEPQLMMQLAESQGEMRPVIARLAEAMQAGRFGIDEQSRTHLRNIDSQIGRLIDEIAFVAARSLSKNCATTSRSWPTARSTCGRC